ncbi:MAG: maleylpyruvate isomerase, partial [Actinomycetota bacterium]|nr:maleylpyruvate isomerase [Actinomycetota bacterium]
ERLPGVDHEPFGIYPFQRWREVEVHHADLGVGYSSADWPESLAARWLPETLATLPERTDQRQLLAWALGRSDAAPPLQAWR